MAGVERCSLCDDKFGILTVVSLLEAAERLNDIPLRFDLLLNLIDRVHLVERNTHAQQPMRQPRYRLQRICPTQGPPHHPIRERWV